MGISMKEFISKAKKIDIGSIDAVGDLYESIEALLIDGAFDIQNAKQNLKSYPEVESVIIGLWSYGFLNNPVFQDGLLVGYNKELLNHEDQSEVIEGLVSVIRNCRVDLDDDESAIDIHYSACGRLYRFTGDKAEEYLISGLKSKPTYSLIESLGVLVGHENQGFLRPETIKLLIDFASSKDKSLKSSARRVLLEDVNRVNRYNSFLDKEIVLEHENSN